jgi:hypothetical protein
VIHNTVKGTNRSRLNSITTSDKTIQELVEIYAFRPATKKYRLVRQDICIFDITLDDGELMLILSSGKPIEIQKMWAGKECVIVMGQMSTETIKRIAEKFNVEFKDEGKGIYKLVSCM